MCRQSDRCPYASWRNDLGDEEEGGDCSTSDSTSCSTPPDHSKTAEGEEELS